MVITYDLLPWFDLRFNKKWPRPWPVLRAWQHLHLIWSLLPTNLWRVSLKTRTFRKMAISSLGTGKVGPFLIYKWKELFSEYKSSQKRIYCHFSKSVIWNTLYILRNVKILTESMQPQLQNIPFLFIVNIIFSILFIEVRSRSEQVTFQEFDRVCVMRIWDNM